jgi:peptidoglycan/xylan/chitin deacetylase (PgdA/CDA1 family)
MATAIRIRHSIKHVLYGGAAELPRITGITAMRRLPSRANSLRVLAYHKVSDQRPNIIAVGISLFRRQQECLASNYRVISPDELAEHLAFGTPLPDKAVLLTFDDGYTSVLRHAYPILKQFGHRAMIFVPTDYAGGGILPHDRVVPGEDRVLSYEDLDSMRDVFEIGSHGRSHRILTALQPHEIESEVVESKLNLERHLGTSIRAFAYPNGGFGDFNEETEEVVRRAGYQFCFTGIAGTNLPPANPLRLKRYNVEDFGLRYFKSLLDGSADLLRLKDSLLGVSVKALVNRTLGLA